MWIEHASLLTEGHLKSRLQSLKCLGSRSGSAKYVDPDFQGAKHQLKLTKKKDVCSRNKNLHCWVLTNNRLIKLSNLFILKSLSKNKRKQILFIFKNSINLEEMFRTLFRIWFFLADQGSVLDPHRNVMDPKHSCNR